MRYIFSLTSAELQEKEIEILKKYDLFGIVLFKRNISSEEQVRKLNSDIKNKLGSHLKICVDQEGGRVQRVKFTKNYPSMLEFTKNDEKFMEENVRMMSRELKNLGFDINFAPVVDLTHQVETNLISDRSFGSDFEYVIQMSEKFIKYSTEEGIETVLKHIPGHGRANVDSHLELPRVLTSLEMLENTDFIPFKRLSNVCNMAMTAHVVYDAIDSEYPATVSKKCIDYIRNSIGFNGLLITDAVEMGAMIKFFDSQAKLSNLGVNHHDSNSNRGENSEEIFKKMQKACSDAGIDVYMDCRALI